MAGNGDLDWKDNDDFDGLPEGETVHGNPLYTCEVHGPHVHWVQFQLTRDTLDTCCMLCIKDMLVKNGVQIISSKAG